MMVHQLVLGTSKLRAAVSLRGFGCFEDVWVGGCARRAYSNTEDGGDSKKKHGGGTLAEPLPLLFVTGLDDAKGKLMMM